MNYALNTCRYCGSNQHNRPIPLLAPGCPADREINTLHYTQHYCTVLLCTVLLYQAFVLPHVDYCSVVWNHCGVILRDHVERIQKYALRIIHGKPPRTSSEPLRRALGWTTLEKRRYKALVCLVHRCLSDEAPSFLCSKFRPNTALGYIRTRGANKLHLPRPKTEYFQSTFTFQGALLYNQLPEIIRRLKQFKSFKAALHDHLLN